MKEVLGFINEKMKVLLIIKKHQIEIDEMMVCPLNQQEIANLVPCGKLKVNQMIKELIDDEYVEMMRQKGRYIITEKGQELLRKMSLED
jgi:predicted transcriptional regulator